jgi:hypothetical protein
MSQSLRLTTGRLSGGLPRPDPLRHRERQALRHGKVASGAVWVDPDYEEQHQERLQGLRVRLFEGTKAEAAVLAVLTTAGTGLHPIDIAAAIAPTIGVTDATKLVSRARDAGKRLVTAGTLKTARDGRRTVFSI